MESTNSNKVTGTIQLALSMVSYNLKIVFGGRFIYFLLTALGFFFLVTISNLYDDYQLNTAEVYELLIFPAVLTIFYPVIYNIQNDKNARMLEIIFSIPNYRYKVYLVRFLISLLLLTLVLFFMAGFTWLSVLQVPVFQLVFQLLYPLFFLSCLAFLLTTITYNGNTSAVFMIIFGLLFLVLAEPLEANKWNLFLNPFRTPQGMSQHIWQLIVKQNRIILLIGSTISLLWGFINLQKREKFI